MKWIVVVEDDLSTLHMMQEILASEGYGILTCANGAALEAAQQRSARVRKERYAAGLCYCRLHFIAGIAKGNGITMHFYEALLQKFESANFRCFYTGVPLVPGINACVVHLYSRCRYPDQIADLENLVWCDKWMKGHLSYQAFLSLCDTPQGLKPRSFCLSRVVGTLGICPVGATHCVP